MPRFAVVKVKRLLQNAALLAVTVGVCLFLGELAVRLLYPQYLGLVTDRGVFAYDAELGWRGRANVELRQRVSGSGTVGVRTNSHGFRDDDLPFERTPGKARVVFLGDSMTFGYGVEEEQRFGEQLEKLHGSLESMSLGISAYATDQELLVWRSLGKKYAPDFAAVVFVPNDPEPNASPFGHGFPKPYFVDVDGELALRNVPVPKSQLKLRMKYWLMRNCAGCNLAREIIRSRAIQIVPVVVDEHVETDAEVVDESAQWNITARLLTEMKKDVEAAGAKFFIVTVIHTDPMADDLRWNDRVEAWAAENGVRCVSTHLPFRAFIEKTGADTLFLPDRHWSADGHRVAAEAIHRSMIEWGWIQGTATATTG
jgi:hypothetical protein